MSRAVRGQLTLDFLVGVSVFLLAVAFAVAFVPELFVPFGDAQARPLVAERAADATLHVTGGTTGALNTTCTFAFFGHASDAGCAFDAADPPAARLGFGSDVRLNVTLERNTTGGPAREVLCADAGGVAACPGDGSGDRLAAGDAVPRSGHTVVATTRVVRIDGTTAALRVRVW